MIKPFAFDVEVLPNFFSITFVDIASYFSIFKDAVDKKGKPIPLIQKLTVAEIKERLNKVQTVAFYITDEDDSMLLPMIAYINDMRAVFKDQNPVRYDLYGYNIIEYDDLMVACLLMYFDKFDTSKELIKHLDNISKHIIQIHKEDKSSYFKDKTIEDLRGYKLPYASIDVMKIFALNKVGKMKDKDGKTIAFPKSLKQTSINLQWYRLLEWNMPPIGEKDLHYYKHYKVQDLDYLNEIIGPFDRYILPEYIPEMMEYNLNDVFIVCEMARIKPDEIRLRYSISNSYGINALSSSRSNISDKLLVKYYAEYSGLSPKVFRKQQTKRTALSFKKIIFPHIKFKTKQLQDMLEEMKKVVIYRTNKDAFSKEIEFYDTTYTLATGGIHTQDRPGILRSTKDATYIHWDYTSYYPSIMISFDVAPAHLNKNIFVKLVKYFKDTRVAAKHGGDKEVVPGIPNKVVAEVLKIVINAIYGKLGDENFWLFDNLAKLIVTINGQLMTMTLVEELELNGIHCVSANTDGIVIKVPNDKRAVLKEITDRWNETNKMSADGEEYEFIISRDINNYLDKQKDGTVEYKGDFDPKMYLKDLQKGYDAPIVAHAVSEYFINNVPIMETLTKATNILDFCKTQNVGRKFKLVYTRVVDGKIVKSDYQRNTRFYVSNYGGILEKVSPTIKGNLCAGFYVTPLNDLDDSPINTRDINYKYYYQECYKIINPIQLKTSPKGSGKTRIKKYAGLINDLFDLDEQNQD